MRICTFEPLENAFLTILYNLVLRAYNGSMFY